MKPPTLIESTLLGVSPEARRFMIECKSDPLPHLNAILVVTQVFQTGVYAKSYDAALYFIPGTLAVSMMRYYNAMLRCYNLYRGYQRSGGFR